jgi:hypothetical protein
VSEYGKRATPVVARTLSSEILERWRSRERALLNRKTESDEPAVPAESAAAETPAATDATVDHAQRRHAVRQRTLIGAQVVFNDLMSTYNCTVRDLSATGARIKLNAPVQVPQAFMLRFSDGRIRQCKVRRRNALELGIEFLN